jgi:hypothetical protein
MSIVSSRKMNSGGTSGGMIMMSPLFMSSFRPREYTSARPSVIHVTCSLTWRVSGTTAPFFAVHFPNVRFAARRYCRNLHGLRVEGGSAGIRREMRTDIWRNTARRSIFDLRKRHGANLAAGSPTARLFFVSVTPQQNARPLQICSDQPEVPFDRLDHVVHLPAPYLFGHAESEALGRVERNMRRER